MTDAPPVDTGTSTGDTPENREAFAHATATALGEWMSLEDWQRRAIGALAPKMARALYLADLTIDAMLDDPADEYARDELLSAVVVLPEPGPLLARLGRCTAEVALPDDGTFAICATRLVNGACPFAAHHADAPGQG